MTITAKYPGKCTKCSQPIAVGAQIEWAKGSGAVHVRCAQSTGTPAASMPHEGGPWAGSRGGVRHEKGTNRRTGNCERCGEYLLAGKGRLEYCVEDSGCMKHFDESGYHLYCRDSKACQTNRAEAKAAREKAIADEAPRKAAADTLRALIAAPKGEPVTEHLTDQTAEITIGSQWHSRSSYAAGSNGAVRMAGETVTYYHPGMYDDYRETQVTVRDAELAIRIRAAVEQFRAVVGADKYEVPSQRQVETIEIRVRT